MGDASLAAVFDGTAHAGVRAHASTARARLLARGLRGACRDLALPEPGLEVESHVIAVAEAGRRLPGRGWSARLESLPILALTVHSACNCRCVMCDIWKANADKREIAPADLDRHHRGICGAAASSASC